MKIKEKEAGKQIPVSAITTLAHPWKTTTLFFLGCSYRVSLRFVLSKKVLQCHMEKDFWQSRLSAILQVCVNYIWAETLSSVSKHHTATPL